MINGRNVDFSYKLINYIMQGSAADQIKESTNQWYAQKGKDTHLLALVHDEINISAPIGDDQREMAVLKKCMNANIADVPFLSEGFIGPNWHEIKGCE